MTKTLPWLTAAAAALCLAGAASAQPGRASVTLYELPNFQGRSVTLTGPVSDLGDWRFNDRAQSAQFRGRWLICEHDDYRGRCQEVGGDVRDLTAYGLSGQVSSLQPAGVGRPGARPGAGAGWGGPRVRGVEGVRTVFFARPTVRGLDVAAGQHGADTFCRHQGLGRAVWFDSGERAASAIGPDGEIVIRTPVLRDLLCRK